MVRPALPKTARADAPEAGGLRMQPNHNAPTKFERKITALKAQVEREEAEAKRIRKRAKAEDLKSLTSSVVIPGRIGPAKKKQQRVPTIVEIAKYWSTQPTF